MVTAAAAPSDGDDAYNRHKKRAAARQAAISQDAREIGPLPEVPEALRQLVDECRLSLKRFCEVFLSETFCIAWSEDHLKVISILERVVLEGGLFALAMPRGSGKTSLVTAAAVWAILYGHRRFVAIIGATATAATGILETIKSIIEQAEPLGDCFPAACYPIRRLEGINQRTAGQTLGGDRTKIRWTGNQLVFPSVPGAASSGAVVRVAGITGAVRGMQARTTEGEILRPDLALIDDPQTDDSARSLIDTAKRERSIKGAVLGLSGPGKKIAAAMPCTVIAPDDLADRLLDKERSPDWQGQKLTLLRSMPNNLEAWNNYRDARADSLKEYGDLRAATAYYVEHQATLDAGAVASWPERFEPGQASAIQYAMDIWARDPASFWSEYQQQPMVEELGGAGALNAKQVAERFNGFKQGERPDWTEFITAGIDIQQDILFYVITGWSRSLRGQVMHYGAWPEQGKPYFALSDIRVSLAKKYQAATVTEGILQGLSELVGELLAKDFGGKEIDLVACDGNWAPSTDTVYEVARSAGHRFLPYHGRFIGAASLAIESWKREPGDREGPGWRMAYGKRRQKHLFSDANYWKTRVAELMRTSEVDQGIWLFGNRAEQHRMFADHCAAEYPIAVEGRGRKLDEWKQRPGRDNHWWDCLVSSAVAASFLGAMGIGQAKPREKKIVTMGTARTGQAKRRA